MHDDKRAQGIKGDELEQDIADVVTAGLVERHVDKPGFVILRTKGWAIARNLKWPLSAGSAAGCPRRPRIVVSAAQCGA